MQFYSYQRVSTKDQDTLRQKEAIELFCKEHGIVIPSENNFIDHYTGKTFDREDYQRMKRFLKQGDYLIVKEIDRLGRDWDKIKEEWKELKDRGINIIIIDTPILSDPLHGEKSTIDTLDNRLLQEQVLTLLCYMAQKEREKISQRTKEALQVLKRNGKVLGRPKGGDTTRENFIETLRLRVTFGLSIVKACNKTHFPESTYNTWIRRYKKEADVYDDKTILDLLVKGDLL